MRPVAARPRVRPLQGALGGDDSDVEVAVVGLGVVESADAAVMVPTLPNRTRLPARRRFPAVDADLRRHRLVRTWRSPVSAYAKPPGRVLQPVIGVIDHLGVDSGPGHDSEVFAVQLAEIEAAARTVEGYAYGLREGGRIQGCRRAGSRCTAGRDLDVGVGPGVSRPHTAEPFRRRPTPVRLTPSLSVRRARSAPHGSWRLHARSGRSTPLVS